MRFENLLNKEKIIKKEPEILPADIFTGYGHDSSGSHTEQQFTAEDREVKLILPMTVRSPNNVYVTDVKRREDGVVVTINSQHGSRPDGLADLLIPADQNFVLVLSEHEWAQAAAVISPNEFTESLSVKITELLIRESPEDQHGIVKPFETRRFCNELSKVIGFPNTDIVIRESYIKLLDEKGRTCHKESMVDAFGLTHGTLYGNKKTCNFSVGKDGALVIDNQIINTPERFRSVKDSLHLPT